MSTKQHSGRVRSVYEFIKAHRDEYGVQTMGRLLGVAPSGYYKCSSSRSRAAAKRTPGSCV